MDRGSCSTFVMGVYGAAGSREVQPRAAGSLLGFAGGLGWDADGQGTWLDIRVEDGGLTDDVAVELVVVLTVDGDPYSLSRVLVDLVVLLGASGDEP